MPSNLKTGRLILSSKFQAFSQLRNLLLMMETDLGITNLTEDERALLAAIIDIQDDDGKFESDVLRSHTLVEGLSHGSYYRALRTLRENNFIDKRDGRKRSLYKLLPHRS